MLALGFGLTAAIIWSVHDLLARKLSQGAQLLPIAMLVMATGCVILVPIAVIAGDWAAMTRSAWSVAVVSGLAIALAIGSLYKAFSLAPVRLVSPVVGAYPMLSLAIAVAQGRTSHRRRLAGSSGDCRGHHDRCSFNPRRFGRRLCSVAGGRAGLGHALGAWVSPRPSPWRKKQRGKDQNYR